MEKVLARREVNRKTLEQYILDESERSKSSVPAGCRCIAPNVTSRGTCATACMSAVPCGSTAWRVGEEERAVATKNAGFAASARGRNGKPRTRRRTGEIVIGSDGVAHQRHRRCEPSRASCRKRTSWSSSSSRATTTSPDARQLEGQEVLQDRVLPDGHVRRRRRGKEESREKTRHASSAASKTRRAASREARMEQDIERRMNKTALDHAVGRSEGTPDRQVHVRQRLARLPAGRVARSRRRHPRVDGDGTAVPGRLAAARHAHPRGRHARQRLVRGRLRHESSPSTAWPKSRRSSGSRSGSAVIRILLDPGLAGRPSRLPRRQPTCRMKWKPDPARSFRTPRRSRPRRSSAKSASTATPI